MEIILVGSALIAIIVFVILLAVLRAGIRNQEQARCLTCEPPGLSAALTRRLVGGLYVRGPIPGARDAVQADQPGIDSSLVCDENESPTA
jgi:hypothetical protein